VQIVLHRGQKRRVVHAVLRRDDYRVDRRQFHEGLFPVVEEKLVGDAVIAGDVGPLYRVRLGGRHDLEHVRIEHREPSEGVPAPASGSQKKRFYRFHFSPSCAFAAPASFSGAADNPPSMRGILARRASFVKSPACGRTNPTRRARDRRPAIFCPLQ
jgi:hypothetical protein